MSIDWFMPLTMTSWLLLLVVGITNKLLAKLAQLALHLMA
jgi:hypothetical protein